MPEHAYYIGALGMLLILVGLYLFTAPIGECDADRCVHCRERRLAREPKWPPESWGPKKKDKDEDKDE